MYTMRSSLSCAFINKYLLVCIILYTILTRVRAQKLFYSYTWTYIFFHANSLKSWFILFIHLNIHLFSMLSHWNHDSNFWSLLPHLSDISLRHFWFLLFSNRSDQPLPWAALLMYSCTIACFFINSFIVSIIPKYCTKLVLSFPYFSLSCIRQVGNWFLMPSQLFQLYQGETQYI